MDLKKGVPTLFAYCEKLIWKCFFKFKQGTCPWMAFAWIFFFRIFLIFLRGSVGQNIYRDYIVFRGSNISCSLATAQSVIHYSPFTLHSPSSITHRSHCTVRHPLLTVHTAQSVIHYSPFTLHSPSSITHHSHCTVRHPLCTVRHPLLTIHAAQSVIHYSPFTLHSPSSITHRSLCRLHYSLLLVHSADFTIHCSPFALQTPSFFFLPVSATDYVI